MTQLTATNTQTTDPQTTERFLTNCVCVKNHTLKKDLLYIYIFISTTFYQNLFLITSTSPLGFVLKCLFSREHHASVCRLCVSLWQRPHLEAKKGLIFMLMAFSEYQPPFQFSHTTPSSVPCLAMLLV